MNAPLAPPRMILPHYSLTADLVERLRSLARGRGLTHRDAVRVEVDGETAIRAAPLSTDR